MKRYRSHKVVEAAPIHGVYDPPADADGHKVDQPLQSHVDVIEPGPERAAIERIVVPHNFFARGYPKQGDYLVRYEDGYLSWSPKQAFEDGYTAVTEP